MKWILRFLRNSPTIALCFGLSYVFSLYLHNSGELLPYRLFLPIVLVICFTYGIFAISQFLFKNALKRQLWTASFVTIFFTYGSFIDILKQLFYFLKIDFSPNLILFPIWLLVMVLTFGYIRKTQCNVANFEAFLSRVAVIMLVMPLLSLIFLEVVWRHHTRIQSPSSLPTAEAAKIADKNNLPDIYYIVPDSYSNPSIFEKYYHYDNSDLSDYLSKKGFYVATSGTSNYPKTFLSVSSTLNMEYLDYLSVFKNSKDQTIVAPLIQNSVVHQFLKSLGYRYYHLGSWWWPADYNVRADGNFLLESENKLHVDGFTYILFESSLLDPIMKTFFPKAIVDESDVQKRERVIYQFETLPRVAKLPGPKFVFAHIISPHGPYVFNADCSETSFEKNHTNPIHVNYTNQVQCINQKLKKAIDAIIAESKNPPIILLQSDEGAQFLAETLNPKDNWKMASNELIQNKYPVLSAYYLPGVATDSLYPWITPVNAFRTIFNLYFGTQLPLLPDKNYLIPDMQHVYYFKDVTEIVGMIQQ